MKVRRHAPGRRGVVLVFTVMLLVPLIAFIALAVDLGLIAVAKTQAQNAADASAMAAVRTIDGNPLANFRISQALANGMSTGTQNSILSQPIPAGNVNVQLGRYYYNRALATPKFDVGIPGPTNENWSLAQSTVTFTGGTYFARVLGMTGFNVSATATAVHRPRDIALIMDFSGSMRFDSLVGIPYTGTRTMSNNSETPYPVFGHYSATSSAGLYNGNDWTVISGDPYAAANLTVATNAGLPIVNSFYRHATLGSTPIPAFTPAPDSYATDPDGDKPHFSRFNTTTLFAVNAGDLCYGSTTETVYNTEFETNGYDYAGAPRQFQGYTLGPKYWGKTFFIWPPDPRGSVGGQPAKDWRKRFFIMRNTSTNVMLPLDDNAVMWNAGVLRTIGSTVTSNGATYRLEINYNAILQWIQETPNPFPPVLRAGRILYYDAIPTTFSGYNFSNFPPTWSSSVNQNQRFWKEYIDFVLGVEQTSSGASYTSIRANIGYGDDFAWGTVATKSKPVPPTDTVGNVNNSGGYASGYNSWIITNNFSPVPLVGQSVRFGNHATVYRITSTQSSGTQIRLHTALTAAVPNGTTITILTPYMDYSENPRRPKMRLWFGPMSLLDFIGCYNRNRFWWPGTCHEAPLWQAKIGTQAALLDMKNNHPNDHVALIYFSSPQYTSGGSGRFNRVRTPLGQNYQRMIDALWFPISTIDNPGTEIRPFDAAINEVPKGMGGTCYPIAFMLAYNQFSSNPALVNYASSNGVTGAPAGDTGGLGRRGSQRLVIFQTDGMVNTAASASFTNAGAGTSYYGVRFPNEFPTNSGDSVAQSNAIMEHICSLETSSNPGYSTLRKPVLVHCIAFGTLFEPTTVDTDQAAALSRLQYFQFIGGQAGGEQPTATTPLASYKRIIGTAQERVDKLQSAMSYIVQDGVQVSLIR